MEGVTIFGENSMTVGGEGISNDGFSLSSASGFLGFTLKSKGPLISKKKNKIEEIRLETSL